MRRTTVTANTAAARRIKTWASGSVTHSVYIGRRSLAPIGCHRGWDGCTRLEAWIVDRKPGKELQGQDSCPTSERIVFFCINGGPAPDFGGCLLEPQTQNTRGLQLLCVCRTNIRRTSGHDVIDERVER